MDAIQRLPPEVLAHCLAFLPLRDRFAGTLVSRAWRASAVAVPEVWSDIAISSRMNSPESILALVLSRSGRCPVDLIVNDHLPHDLDQGLWTRALHPHMDHIRSIDWGFNTRPTDLFHYSAPALESFSQVGLRGYSLPPALFGGGARNLRRLRLESVSLPKTCPAMATVTDLRIESTENGLSHLFALFPRLRSLTLLRIGTEHASILRGMRPPSTLSELRLHAQSSSVDLLDLYNSWSIELHLTDVGLAMSQRPTALAHLTSLLSDARHIVAELCAAGVVRILVLGSRAGKRSVSLRSAHDDAVAIGFDQARGCLTQLSSLTMSVVLLHKLHLRGSLALPALKDITLAMDQAQERVTQSSDDGRGVSHHTRHIWPWYQLDELAPYVRSLGGIEFLTVEMRCLSRRTPPTAEDARKLVCEYIPRLILSGVEHAHALRVRVRGLPQEATNGLSSELRELQLESDAGTILHSTGPFWI